MPVKGRVKLNVGVEPTLHSIVIKYVRLQRLNSLAQVALKQQVSITRIVMVSATVHLAAFRIRTIFVRESALQGKPLFQANANNIYRS